MSALLFLLLLFPNSTSTVAATRGWRLKHSVDENTQMFHHFEHSIHTTIDLSSIHQAVIAIQSKENVQKLFDLVDQVSNPLRDRYGHHVTRQDIGNLLNYEDAAARVSAYLQKHGFVIEKTSRISDFMTVSANISTWELLLQTKFQYYCRPKISRYSSLQVLRARFYSLPEVIFDDIHAIFQIADFPVLAVNTLQISSMAVSPKAVSPLAVSSEAVSTIAGYVTPAFLNNHLSITNNTGEHQTRQATYQNANYLDPDDLTSFQDFFGIPRQSIDIEYGKGVIAGACDLNLNNCTEAHLDVQYMTAVAQNIENAMFEWPSSSDPWLSWLLYVADLEDPPHVISISYGSYEIAFTSTYLTSFQTQAASLAAMGVTLLAASGDDGVAGFLVRSLGRTYCGYYSMFPASCPYVTAVGGTQGPEINNGAEVACSVSTGSIITTGGGFSTAYTRPSFQSSEVTSFLSRTTASSGYSTSGRGYPDISTLANKYLVVIANDFSVVSGTSASCPVVGAMVSLVNEARLKAGGSLMGWINPFLYQYSSNYTTDIVSGNNKCTADSTICCTQGFTAISGWDPVVGLGVLNFTLFKDAAMSLVDSSTAPTRSPTIAATSAPSRAPTFSPTVVPSVAVTAAPSVLQTSSPTARSPSVSIALSISFLVTQSILDVSINVSTSSATLRSLIANVTCDGMALAEQYCICGESCLIITSDSRRKLTSSTSGVLTAAVTIDIPLSDGEDYASYSTDPSSLYTLLTSTLTAQFADSSTVYSNNVVNQLKAFDNAAFGSAGLSSGAVFNSYVAVYAPSASPTSSPATISSSSSKNGTSFSGGVLIGVIVAIIVVCLIVIIFALSRCYSAVGRHSRYATNSGAYVGQPSSSVSLSGVEVSVTKCDDKVLNV